MRIDISRVHFPVTTLGPGRRLGIWLQGCSIRCPGCISPDTWDQGLGETTLDALTEQIETWLMDADGVTISGGEPFEQPLALAALLSAIRKTTARSILVFTGLPWDRVAPWFLEHPGLVDAVIAEPFDRTAPQTKALRGSDNQTLHLLTDLGRASFADFERDRTAADKRLDVMFDDTGGAWFAGIPERGDFDRLRLGLRRAGHQITLRDRTNAL